MSEPGLSTEEAKRILRTDGYNELPTAKPKGVWSIATEVLREPMFVLLVASGSLYLLLGDYKEGLLLLGSIFVIIGITFYQYQKTERALQALKDLSSPRALVRRDGREVRIPGKEVVSGDVLIINEGDRVPADASLIESVNLSLDESLLTGESVPVAKSVEQGHSDIFSGTLTVQGTGVAVVTTTGVHTQLGKIGLSLQTIDEEPTRLQIEMKTLVKKLALIGVFVSGIVVFAFYLSRGNLINSFLAGLAAAMSLMPEEFPVVMTIFLALGAWKLSRQSVLTRRPSAIETLGSATVLCSDKTGTITQNRMEVAALFDGRKTISPFEDQPKDNTFSDLLRAGARASQVDPIDPMERAIWKAYGEYSQETREGYQLVKEYPLSNKLLAMTRVLRCSQTRTMFVYAKGAPEAIIHTLCKLRERDAAALLQTVAELAAKGYRVIAVAEGCSIDTLPDSQLSFDFTFKGLIALADPVRPEVPNAVRTSHEAGIRVIMITGDYPVTALTIARQIGLASEGGVITGSELAAMANRDLRERIKTTNVFARITPEQKLRIVQALKENGEIVAMTGDGVNDAPALKAAHIGVSMGSKGTDVAREASSLVLLDDNFASIVEAIHSGRRIYDNLQKAMSYIMAIHIPIIGLTLLPAFFSSLPVLLLPLQIVFLELVIDPICAFAFESEQDEKNIMKRKPRRPEDRFFGINSVLSSVLTGSLLLGSVLLVYFLSLHEGHTDGEVRAIAFSGLIISNVFLTLTKLSNTRSALAVIAERNWATLGILTLSLLVMFMTISTSSLRSIFNFEFPGYSHFGPAVTCALLVLIVLEAHKRWIQPQVRQV